MLSILSCVCWQSVDLFWRNVYLGLLPIFVLFCFWYWAAWATCKKKDPQNIKNIHLKQLEKEQTKLKVSRQKEIIKIRAEINEIEMKKTIDQPSEWEKIFANEATDKGLIIIFMISFCPLTLSFVCSSFSSCFRCIFLMFWGNFFFFSNCSG